MRIRFRPKPFRAITATRWKIWRSKNNWSNVDAAPTVESGGQLRGEIWTSVWPPFDRTCKRIVHWLLRLNLVMYMQFSMRVKSCRCKAWNLERTPAVPNYKSLWSFWFIHFAMYLDILLYLDA
jgi:hypothetical protein